MTTLEAVRPAKPNAPGQNGLRILLADASAEDRAAMRSVLQAAGASLEIHQAATGPKALEVLRTNPIDLAFIDRRLPSFDGAQMLKWIEDQGRRSPFLLVSDQLMPRWPAIATQIKAYEVILKPFKPDHIRNVLRAYRRMITPANLLLVDGSDAARRIIGRLLAQSRFAVNTHQTDMGRHALKLVELTHYDLVLMDMTLPDGNGIEMAMRMLNKAPWLRVIMMGAGNDPVARSSVQQLGVAYYLAKPFQPADLENALHDAFRLWRPYLLNALRAA